jgi:hypothetical protein
MNLNLIAQFLNYPVFFLDKTSRFIQRCLSPRGYKKYPGSSVEICKQVVIDRWNGTFFEAGSNLYEDEFWVRDFALCLDGLIDLGYAKKTRENLIWVLDVFEKNKKITTTISKDGQALNFFHYSADSLPLLLYAIKKIDTTLIEKYKDLITDGIVEYYDTVFDKNTNLVKNEPFATPKDVVMRTKTCVANAFLVFLSEILKNDFPDFYNPWINQDLKRHFVESYWNKKGGYFKNDLMDKEGDVISGDANVMPYWLGIIKDKTMLHKSIDSIKRQGLDLPFPLKYQSFYDSKWINNHPIASLSSPNYQGNSIWTMMGPLFIEIEFEVYPQDAKKHLQTYIEWIQKYKTYVEVFEPDGSKFLRGNFGKSSETGMLWAAMIPKLIKKIK